eukprot:m.2651 g.2651  ORF g.2651 m.2651 type:complete len:51 (+) comp3129_c0_seq1:65-217(+)
MIKQNCSDNTKMVSDNNITTTPNEKQPTTKQKKEPTKPLTRICLNCSLLG